MASRRRRRARSPAAAWSSTPRTAPAPDRSRQDDALAAVLSEARDLGFLGPGPAEAHREHAAAFVAALAGRAPGRGVDLGSGGGVPGLVVATALPGWRWELVEAAGRRAAFLEQAVRHLHLEERVEVVHLRAEDHGRRPPVRGRADAVTARSFGPPAVVAECAAPLLRPGGVLVVSEPPGGGADRWDLAGLSALGLGPPEVDPGPPALAVLTSTAPAPDRYPRRAGVPAKRPLW